MSLALTLVGALIFLMPGLIIVIVASQSGPPFIRSPIVSSGSVGILGMVPAFSAVIHGGLMYLSGVNERYCQTHWCAPALFDLNPYPTYLKLVRGSTVAEAEIPAALLCVGVIWLVSRLLGSGLAAVDRWWTWSRPPSDVSGWLHQLGYRLSKDRYSNTERFGTEDEMHYLWRITAPSDDHALVATVFLREPLSSLTGGWVGVLDRLELDSSGAILNVRLKDPAYFDIGPDGRNDPTLTDQYREHAWSEVYRAVTIPAANVASVTYHVSQPVFGNADITLGSLTLEASGVVDTQAEKPKPQSGG